MGDAGFVRAPKRTLVSPEHEELLNSIDKIRAQGIARYIDLPQIIVCGDQSSGKSSCLEAICGLQFPTGDGLCTRFATEYILRRASESSVNISIVPDPGRTDLQKGKLQSFKPSTKDLTLFSTIIEEAAKCMGIGKHNKTFSHDVLRIEISGPEQEHLTVVDLPGLFHSSSRSQNDKDKDAVFSLVTSYIAKPRSIILAVVSAKNDLNNQAVLDFARKHDAEGTRTLGIITKPDTLSKNSPSEQAYLDLARNVDVKFSLGWHVLRNRSWEEQDSTATERDQKEEAFFNRGNWKALDVKNKGIHFLRVRLGQILFDHILKELPSLQEDVETGISVCETRLCTMGQARGTLADQRSYLVHASQKFVALMTAALDGAYSDIFFSSSGSEEGFQKRLRAAANEDLENFTREMKHRGHAVALVDTLSSEATHVAGLPRETTFDDYYRQVQNRMQRNGGRELPGLYNPSIVGDLFFDQAKPWQDIVGSAKDSLLETAITSVQLVLQHVVDKGTMRGILRKIINPRMDTLRQSLSAKTDEILRPHIRGYPFTLDRDFIELMQKKRADQFLRDINMGLNGFLGVNPEDPDPAKRQYRGDPFDVGRLSDAVVKRSTADPDRFAAIDCVNAMLIYYQLASKKLIDAFGMYAAEECLLGRLPEIFTPDIICGLDDDVIQMVAGESKSALIERESLTKKRDILKETQIVLRQLDSHKTNDRTSRSSPAPQSQAGIVSSLKRTSTIAFNSGSSSPLGGVPGSPTTEFGDSPAKKRRLAASARSSK